MDKRRFLKMTGLASLGVVAGCAWNPSLGLFRRPQPKNKHWVWFGPDPRTSDDEWRRKFALMKRSGIDAILPEIFNNRRAHYASDHLPVAAPWLETILPLAHAEGLEVHAWMHSMTLNIPKYFEKQKHWYMVNGRGESTADKPPYVGYYKFLCPSRPESQAIVARRVRELAAIDELDGIHLDYIRYPDVILAEALQPKYDLVQDREYPQFDYCYCDVCVADFKNETGINIADLPDPAASDQWRQFRYDRIVRLVNGILIPAGRARNKVMTAAVFPNWEHVRQNWYRFELDAVLPMLYNRFYNKGIDWIGAECAKGVANLSSQTRLYSGIMVPNDPARLRQMFDISMANGASGMSLFNADSMTDEHWAVLAQATGRSS